LVKQTEPMARMGIMSLLGRVTVLSKTSWWDLKLWREQVIWMLALESKSQQSWRKLEVEVERIIPLEEETLWGMTTLVAWLCKRFINWLYCWAVSWNYEPKSTEEGCDWAISTET